MIPYNFANSMSQSLCHPMTAAELVYNAGSADHEWDTIIFIPL